MTLRSAVWFGAGVMTMMAAGWIGFPRALYRETAQPLEYRHKTHAAKAGMTECESCHSLRDDGAFSGIPVNEGCAGCHSEPAGKSKAELTLVNEYIKAGREVPWLVYSRQPANVRFPHVIHVKRGGMQCKECHAGHGESDALRPYEENRISGYSRDIWGRRMLRFGKRAAHEGMKMDDCERCHEEKGVETGCLACHR